MNIFPADVNISKIHTVMLFGSAKYMQNEWDYYPSALYCNELIFFLDGKTEVFFKGKSFMLQKNSMLFLPKGIQDANYHVHRFLYGQCIDIYFDVDASLPREAIHLENNELALRSLFIKLFHTWSEKTGTYYTKAMALFYEIISLCNINTFIYMPSSSRSRLYSASQYLAQHYLEPNFDVQVLGRVSGWSYSYFKRLFTENYGMPPIKYLTQLRMNHAKELLITQMYSVSDVAEKCGYSDLYYFSAAFKRFFGVSPSAYKFNKNLP